MQLKISPNSKLNDIQHEFNAHFPFLKIAFFSKSHKAFKGSNAKFLITDTDLMIQDVSNEAQEGMIFLDNDTVTHHAEHLFEEEFGLFVQIFRKSGNLWLETSLSDNLTLHEQNEKGKASEHIQRPFSDPMDYREMD